MRQRRDDALELEHVRVVRAELSLELVQTLAEDERVRVRLDRQDRVVVPDDEGAVAQLQPELLVLEDVSVLVAEDRQEDLAAQEPLGRVPVDVEVVGVGRRRAVLEDVSPPRVAVARDPHVVRHHVDDHAHPPGPKLGGERAIVGLGAEHRVEAAVVADVVAVRFRGARLEERRQIVVRDAQGVEVGDDVTRVGEREGAVELQPVGRRRDPAEGPGVAGEDLDDLIGRHHGGHSPK